MGLTEKDRRPNDWAYMTAFDRKDLPSLEEMALHIRETHDTDMIEDFNLKCEQKLLGKTAILDNGLEIKAVTKAGDLVVNGGLDHCIKIILGQVSTRWSHIALTSQYASPPPAVTDTDLSNSSLRIDMSLNGWMEARGMKLFFGGIHGEDNTNTALAQFGVFNANTAGIMLNRNASTFGSADVPQRTFRFVSVPGLGTKTWTSAVFIISVVVEFCPVA